MYINQPPSILVTGATGLVGRYLTRELLQKGLRVKALSRHSDATIFSEEENSMIEWIQGDILDISLLMEIMKDVDQVYHTAAIVTFNPKRKTELFNINIQGTANVVNAAIENKVQKLLHVSSVSAMGRIRPGVEIDETMFWSEETGNSNYGRSKYLAEMEVWRGIGEGLNAVIVNPSIILGAADWNSGSSKIFNAAYNNFPWFTDGASGFVDVRDVVKIMIMLMDSGIHSERFLINAENRSYRDVFTMIANEFGKKPPYKKASRFVSGLVWKIEWLKNQFTNKEPLLTRETALTGQSQAKFSSRKLKKAFPEFNYIPLEKSIADTCKELIKMHNL